MEFNHNRKLSSFEDVISIVTAMGFNLIAVSQLHMEDVFVFEDKHIAKLAYRLIEVESKYIVGVWLGIEDFKHSVDMYERTYANTKVKIFWLKNNIN